MIVDLIRNDLGRIAETGSVGGAGSVRGGDLSHPAHHGLHRDGAAAARHRRSPTLCARCFPAARSPARPKSAPWKSCASWKASPRGAYCGAFGYFRARTAQRAFQRRNPYTDDFRRERGTLGIGGGVVQDSQAAEEYAECLLKARFFEADAPAAGADRDVEIRRRLYAPGAPSGAHGGFGGVVRPGLRRWRARAALHAAVTGQAGALRVRLTLDEAGMFQATAAPLAPNPRLDLHIVPAARRAAAMCCCATRPVGANCMKRNARLRRRNDLPQ